MTQHDHPVYMQRCIELARLGTGQVAPNPMVGAVLVYLGQVIGEGYHAVYGQGHAEVNCISNAIATCSRRGLNQEAIDRIFQSSVLYVSLEPCAHFGKTPPCADLIIRKRIPTVVVGCRDPFPLVDGKGIEKLERAGITVISGVLEAACIRLNQHFFGFHHLKRPYIVLKWAQSVNGKIAAAGDVRTLISNDATNRLVHKWRSELSSILVGTQTALSDDPSLTTRLWSGKNPLRLVVDRQLRLPRSLKVFNGDAHTMVFNVRQQGEEDGISYARIDESRSLAVQVAEVLYQRQVTSLLVEGGRQILQHFIDEGLWDEVRVITNEALTIEVGTAAPQLQNAVLRRQEHLMNDRIDYYTLIND